METSIANINKSLIKGLIEKRSAMAYKIAEAYLLRENASDWEYGEVFKFGVLIVKGRRYFLSQWKDGSLEIDMDAVEAIYRRHSLHIDGPPGLLPEEETTINEHNVAAREWIAQHKGLPGEGAPQTINMDRVGPSSYQASRY